MNLSRTLARQAKKKGICKEWHADLKNISPDDRRAMVEMYLRGIDFCLANEYPSNDFIKAHFDDIAPEMGVFVDQNVCVENSPKCVCLGATNGTVAVTEYGVCEVFAKHDSKLTISAAGNAFVMVDVFDNAEITVSARDRAKVCVNRYGGIVNVDKQGESLVKIREKNKKTY